jgi:hypothetical protein
MRGLPKGDAKNQPNSMQEARCCAFLSLCDSRSERSNRSVCSSWRNGSLLDHIGNLSSPARCSPVLQGSPAVLLLVTKGILSENSCVITTKVHCLLCKRRENNVLATHCYPLFGQESSSVNRSEPEQKNELYPSFIPGGGVSQPVERPDLSDAFHTLGTQGVHSVFHHLQGKTNGSHYEIEDERED